MNEGMRIGQCEKWATTEEVIHRQKLGDSAEEGAHVCHERRKHTGLRRICFKTFPCSGRAQGAFVALYVSANQACGAITAMFIFSLAQGRIGSRRPNTLRPNTLSERPRNPRKRER